MRKEKEKNEKYEVLVYCDNCRLGTNIDLNPIVLSIPRGTKFDDYALTDAGIYVCKRCGCTDTIKKSRMERS